jgi:hypothetical protein
MMLTTPLPMRTGSMSLLMSVVQVGSNVALTYGDDITAVFEAAFDPPPR